MSKKNKKNEKQEEQKRKRKPLLKKGWWRHPKFIGGVIVVILSVIFFFVSFFWVPGEIYYHVKETYSFTAEENASLNLAVLLPSSDSKQDVLEPQVEWPGTWQLNEDGRLQVLTMSASIQAGETIRAVITYRVNLAQGAARWVDEPVTAADSDASAAVQSDAPEIIAQADLLQLAEDEEGTLRHVFAFTKDYLVKSEDSSSNEDESALAAYLSGTGGETGRVNLLAALSRANGLPARTISGQKLPYSIPFIPVAKAGEYPGTNAVWNEVFFDSAWALVDPNAAGRFYKPAVLGWTDGRYLTYAETDQVLDVIQGLVQDAEADGQWTVSSTDSLRYVAWTDAEQGQVDFATKVSVMTIWDARWVMLISLIVITLLIAWLMEEKRQKRYRSSKGKK